MLRKFTEAAARVYLLACRNSPNTSIDRLTDAAPEHIRESIAHLFEARRLSSSAVNQQVAVLRFFYIKTIRKAWSAEDILS